MDNLIILLWWFTISKFSLYNFEKLYYLKYNKNNINALRIYQASWVFIISCGIRSIFPRIDGQRICLIDIWLSYPLVGRICATFGELAFVYQLTLVTKIFAQKLNCYEIYNGMNMILGLNFIAQILCWNGVLFQNDLMHVFEESIWMISMLLIGSSYLYFSDLITNEITRINFLIAYIISIGYAIFMMCVDVPMYYNRFLESSNLQKLSLLDGINDLASCKVNSSYSVWESEIPWMTGYFIGTTYVSIKLNNFQELVIE
jgi:hypothetical protein